MFNDLSIAPASTCRLQKGNKKRVAYILTILLKIPIEPWAAFYSISIKRCQYYECTISLMNFLFHPTFGDMELFSSPFPQHLGENLMRFGGAHHQPFGWCRIRFLNHRLKQARWKLFRERLVPRCPKPSWKLGQNDLKINIWEICSQAVSVHCLTSRFRSWYLIWLNLA